MHLFKKLLCSICSWVAKLMVEKGYTVRGTVRSATNPRSVLLAEDFKSIPGDGKLVLFEADILQESTLTDALFQDVEYVFHVASPFFIKGKIHLIDVTLAAKTKPRRDIVYISSYDHIHRSGSIGCSRLGTTKLVNSLEVQESGFCLDSFNIFHKSLSKLQAFVVSHGQECGSAYVSIQASAASTAHLQRIIT